MANFLDEVINLSYSIRSMGRGGAEIAEPYGSDAMTSNPAGLAQSGRGLQYNNLDYSNGQYRHRQSTLFHRQSFGVGVWQVETDTDALETFGLGIAKRNRNGVDWGGNI